MLTPNHRREAACSSVDTFHPGFQRRCTPRRDDLCFTEPDPGDSPARRPRHLAEMWARLTHDAQERVLDRSERDLELLIRDSINYTRSPARGSMSYATAAGRHWRPSHRCRDPP